MTLTSDQRSQILRLADQSVRVADIAASLGVSKGQVYALLKAERPARQRSPRRRTSDVSERVQALAALKPRDIAERLDISRQYVYRVLSKSR